MFCVLSTLFRNSGSPCAPNIVGTIQNNLIQGGLGHTGTGCFQGFKAFDADVPMYGTQTSFYGKYNNAFEINVGKYSQSIYKDNIGYIRPLNTSCLFLIHY